ncbi:MAG: hypothetical protein CMI23_03405 [Opitutae bacterium]|nr:hypothetical protein [Opitutae bacterium]
MLIVLTRIIKSKPERLYSLVCVVLIASRKPHPTCPNFSKKLSQTTKHVHIQPSQLEKNLLSDSVVRNVKRRHQVSFVPIRFD